MSNTPTDEKDLDTKTEEIVQSMMYVSDRIESKSKELSLLRDTLYMYKRGLQKLYPDEDINIVEYLTKRKILERNNSNESN